MYIKPRSPASEPMCETRPAQKHIRKPPRWLWQVSRLLAPAHAGQGKVGTRGLKGPGLCLGRGAGGEGQHGAAGYPVQPWGLPHCLNPPEAEGSHCPAQAMHIKFTLIHALPKMGWSLKERDATKSSCLFSTEDKSPTIAQATGRKQTQILSRESLAGAG